MEFDRPVNFLVARAGLRCGIDALRRTSVPVLTGGSSTGFCLGACVAAAPGLTASIDALRDASVPGLTPGPSMGFWFCVCFFRFAYTGDGTAASNASRGRVVGDATCSGIRKRSRIFASTFCISVAKALALSPAWLRLASLWSIFCPDAERSLEISFCLESHNLAMLDRRVSVCGRVLRGVLPVFAMLGGVVTPLLVSSVCAAAICAFVFACVCCAFVFGSCAVRMASAQGGHPGVRHEQGKERGSAVKWRRENR